jgi:hypothetical protein
LACFSLIRLKIFTGVLVMKNSSDRFLRIALSLTSVLFFGQAAQAASFAETQTEVDWLIHNDSFNDSIAGNDVGGTRTKYIRQQFRSSITSWFSESVVTSPWTALRADLPMMASSNFLTSF